MATSKIRFLFSAVCSFLVLFPAVCHANDLAISNVRLGARDLSSKTVQVYFDVAWDNSWRNKINHDASWLVVRLNDATAAVSEKKLCRVVSAGLNPVGVSKGSNTTGEIFVPSDKTGAFIRRSEGASTSAFSSKNVMLTVDYGSSGFSEGTDIGVTIFGLEMVYVPQGAFHAGDGVSTASLRQGSGDSDPWQVASEEAINVSGIASNGSYYVSSGVSAEFATGASFVVPGAYPKGFKGFYAMKYEITEGQWSEFVNSLSAEARVARDLTDASHKNSDVVLKRNTISCSGSPLVCISARPSRAVNYLNWMDFCAFLDWAALRPMTELEFEKLARGPYLPIAGEFAWANTTAVAAGSLSGADEKGEEFVQTSGANAHFNSVSLSGGDTLNGPEYQQGPLRAGIFATNTSDRSVSGAGIYGAMELSGDLAEFVVSLGNADGLLFTGGHGDGYLTSTVAQGNANVAGWPGADADLSKGITNAQGSGLRGGSWADTADRLRVSDRQEASLAAPVAQPTYGGRGVRTDDGE